MALKLSPDEIAEIAELVSLSNEKARELIMRFEALTDQKLASGEICNEEAWDMYFGLLHECDERDLIEDRERIVAKIDTKTYNPFQSRNPMVVIIARIRAKGIGIDTRVLH